MTAATSTSKKSFFGARIRNKIIENKKLLIVNSVLELIGLPLITIVGLYSLHLSNTKNWDALLNFDGEAIMTVSVIAIILSILSGMVIALFSFRYLFTKSLADMNYALPLTSRQRFFADYLSGITLYMLPALCAALLSLIIMGIGSIFVDTHKIWEHFSDIFTLAVIVAVGMLMFYTISVLAITCCGSPFEAIFSILAVNTVIPATIGCVWFLIVHSTQFGLTNDSILYSSIFTATSPSGNAVFLIDYIELFGGDSTSLNTVIRWLIPSLIFTAAFFAGSILLYIRRKAESVSKPYIYKTLYYLIVSLGVFCIMSAFLIMEGSVAAGIIICAIIYFLLEVISKRGFRRFWISALRFAATIAAVFVISSLCDNTAGFGTAKYVPRSAAVDSVSFRVGYNELHISGSFEFEDPNVIKEVTALHKELVNRRYNNDKYEYKSYNGSLPQSDESHLSIYDTAYLDISYDLKNGTSTSREYKCSTDMLDGLYTAIVLSDEYAEYTAGNLIRSLINEESMVYYGTFDEAINAGKGAKVTLFDKLYNSIGTRTFSNDEIRELYDAYVQDLKNMTEEEFKNAPIYGYLGEDSCWIRETFTNTIKILEDHGFTSTEISLERLNSRNYINMRLGLYTDFTFYNQMEHYFHYGDDYNYYDLTRSDLTRNNIVDTISNIFPIQYGYVAVAPIGKADLNDDFLKLMDSATPVIIGEKPLGVLYLDNIGSFVYIPDTEENRSLIDKVYEEYFEGQMSFDDDWDVYAEDYPYDY